MERAQEMNVVIEINVVFTDMHHCITSDTVYAVQRMGDATCTHLFMRFFLSEER